MPRVKSSGDNVSRIFDTQSSTNKEASFFRTRFIHGPRYCKVNLSEILDGSIEIPDNVNCKIIADVSIEYPKLKKILVIHDGNIRRTIKSKY
jgi:hypothetical protein